MHKLRIRRQFALLLREHMGNFHVNMEAQSAEDGAQIAHQVMLVAGPIAKKLESTINAKVGTEA